MWYIILKVFKPYNFDRKTFELFWFRYTRQPETFKISLILLVNRTFFRVKILLYIHEDVNFLNKFHLGPFLLFFLIIFKFGNLKIGYLKILHCQSGLCCISNQSPYLCKLFLSLLVSNYS